MDFIARRVTRSTLYAWSSLGALFIFEVEPEIERDHEEIERVEPDDVGGDGVAVGDGVGEFVADAGRVAGNHEAEEERAFAGDDARAEGFGDGEGPAGAEADEHDDFVDAGVHNQLG